MYMQKYAIDTQIRTAIGNKHRSVLCTNPFSGTARVVPNGSPTDTYTYDPAFSPEFDKVGMTIHYVHAYLVFQLA